MDYNKNNDKDYRDACLKAYVCSVLDMLPTEFDEIKKNSNTSSLIEIIKNDMENRIKNLLK